MPQEKMLLTEKVFDIIAQEIGIQRNELDDDTEFADYGVDDILATSIIENTEKQTGIRLPITTFTDHCTIHWLHKHLQKIIQSSEETQNYIQSKSPLSLPAKPLSIVLQGNIKSAKKTIFLLPDGGGSAAAYLRLPVIDPDICLIGMNSPFLDTPKGTEFSIEGISRLWAEEIRFLQSTGPYTVGGWSAGGYYSFEIAKYLIQDGEKVENLVLIDCPCRLVYEELPIATVKYLSQNNLMGNWETKKPPRFLIEHFDMTLKAVSKYIPSNIEPSNELSVFLILAADGVLKDTDTTDTGLDLSIKINELLLLRPKKDPCLGWRDLFPEIKLSTSTMPGNHFTIIHPPHCQKLGSLLRDIVQDKILERKHLWYEHAPL